MSRRLRRWLIVLGVLLVLGVAFVWSLPEIVKWQALKQIPALTGRAASIEDIDINLFTGRVAIKEFRLAEPDPAQTLLEVERLDVRVGPRAIVAAFNDSPVEFSAQDIDLTPPPFAGKFSIQNFSLLQVRPYLPPLPATLDSGIAGVNMAVKLELGPGPGGLAIGLVTGDVGIASLALSQPGKTTPSLAVPRIAIGLKEVNLVSRVVTLSSVEIEGRDLRAVRDKREQIDLLDLTKKPAAASAAASSEPAAAHKPAPAAKVPAAGAAGTPAAPAPAPPADAGYKITVEKVALKGSATFTDEAISSPPTVLKIGGLTLQLGDVTWPAARPMQLDLALLLPGGGKFGAKGPVAIDPVDVSLALTTHDA